MHDDTVIDVCRGTRYATLGSACTLQNFEKVVLRNSYSDWRSKCKFDDYGSAETNMTTDYIWMTSVLGVNVLVMFSIMMAVCCSSLQGETKRSQRLRKISEGLLSQTHEVSSSNNSREEYIGKKSGSRNDDNILQGV